MTQSVSPVRSNVASTIAVIRELKTQRTSQRVLRGGPETARQYFKYQTEIPPDLAQAADNSVIGEGERAAAGILERGVHQKAGSFIEESDVSALPFPLYRGLDLRAYPKGYANGPGLCPPLQFLLGTAIILRIPGA